MRRRAFVFACAAAVLACAEEAPPPPGPPPVYLVPVTLRDVEDRIEASGELLARSQASVAAEVAGRVTQIRIDEGQPAREGAVVLEIDPERRRLDVESAQAGLAETEAALIESERDFERIERLHASDATSDARLDQARATLARARSRHEAARVQLGVAKRALRDASVVAPFGGLIARRMVSRGEFVNVGFQLFELVALDPVEVEFHLPERDSGRVHMGDVVRVGVSPFPDEVFEARVTVVSPTIDTRTRTLPVKAVLPNPEGRLRPGLFARVDLGVNHRADVPMLPEEAILQRAEGAVAFRLRGDDTVERRVVELGVFHDGYVEVVEGLDGGDWVVARGHTELVNGARVSPRDTEGNPLPRVDVGALDAEDAE